MATNFRDIGAKQYVNYDIGAIQHQASGGASSTPITLTATCTTTASAGASKAFLRLLTATCTTTSKVIRGIAKKITATCTSTVTGVSGKAFLRLLTATCTSSVSFITGSAIGKLLTTTCTTTASFTKRAGIKLLATCTSTTALIRGIAKKLTATCASTVTGNAYKAVVYVKNLFTTVTTASAIQTVYAQFVQLLQSDALRLYRPKSYPTIKEDPSTYILAELRKIAAAMEQHVQVTKDLEQRINDGGL